MYGCDSISEISFWFVQILNSQPSIIMAIEMIVIKTKKKNGTKSDVVWADVLEKSKKKTLPHIRTEKHPFAM